MAKKNEPKLNYSEEIRVLKNEGPKSLYLLHGEEDYLREHFAAAVKKACIGDGDEEFNCRRIDASSFDIREFADAVDAMPFMAERTFVEIRSFDINKCKQSDADRLKSIISDIPDYCTVAIVLDTGYALDGRISLVKAVKSAARVMQFSAAEQGMLTDWVIKRFVSLGKRISPQNAQQLIFLSGAFMTALIPEIEKIAAFSKDGEITISDIEKTASRVSEANAFEMCDMISAGRFDDAAVLLEDLLSSKEHPIMLLAVIGQQMRRLYAARLAQERALSASEGMELTGIKFDFAYNKVRVGAKRVSLEKASSYVTLCAEYDFKMKSTGLDAQMLLKELFVRLAAGA